MEWKKYQEEAADFFRSLGLEAETDVTINGVRTKHDVDVLVKSHHVGFGITWIIECKHWSSKVSKLHVLALREIVSDTGADRGILLAENGFQSGAIEAAALTNIHVTSLAEVTNTASHDILSMKLRELYDRMVSCKEEYWKISKSNRIDCGLRPDKYEIGYSSSWVITISEDLLAKAFRGIYPIFIDKMHASLSGTVVGQELPQKIDSLKGTVFIVESLIKNLECKIDKCKNLIRSSF